MRSSLAANLHTRTRDLRFFRGTRPAIDVPDLPNMLEVTSILEPGERQRSIQRVLLNFERTWSQPGKAKLNGGGELVLARRPDRAGKRVRRHGPLRHCRGLGEQLPTQADPQLCRELPPNRPEWPEWPDRKWRRFDPV